MLIGYARVSTEDQNLDLQMDALAKAGVEPENVYTDKASGISTKRVGLKECLRVLEKGDTLIVWRLDRAARSLKHLLSITEDLVSRGVGFRSLTEGFETQTAGGRLILHIMGAIAEFERQLIVERTKAGVAAAQARGVRVGRVKIATPEKIAEVKRLLAAGMSVQRAAKEVGLAPSTIYRDIPGGAQSLFEPPDETS